MTGPSVQFSELPALTEPLAAADRFPVDDVANGVTSRATLADVADFVEGRVGEFNVKAYGAVGDGVTNDRPAFVAAFAAALAAGGGRVTAPPGTYFLSGYTTRSLLVPINGDDYATEAQDVSAHFHLIDATDLHIDMPGVTLRSAESGFNMFVFDGARNVVVDIGRILTPTAGDVGDSVLGVEGLNAYAFTSSARDSYNIVIPRAFFDHCKTGVYVFGAADAAYRVRGVRIGGVRHDWGSYGVALHNNGDDVWVGSYVSSYVGRPGFLYGVDSVRGHWHSLQRLGGLAFLCKAYDRDLTNLDISYRVVQENTSVDAIGFASEHNVAAQATPCSIRNVRLDYDDTGSGAGMVGIRFQYLVDGVPVSTVATCLFDNFTIRGTMDGTDGLTTLVLQSPRGLLNIDDLLLDGAPLAADIFEDGGFYGVISGEPTRPVPERGVALEPVTTGGTTQYGATIDHRASAGATALIIGFFLRTGSAAAGVTHALLHGIRLGNPVKGAGSTITKAVAVFFEAMTTGTTNFVFETNNPFIHMGVHYYAGAGTPEAAITAPVGSIYTRTDGGAGTTLYVKESGTGNTGWVAK